MIRAALTGALASAPTAIDPIFGLRMPTTCPDVPPEILNPRNTWKDKGAYDAKARELAEKFRKNFEPFAASAPERVRLAGPIAPGTRTPSA
jgi:phosphoenolpyruvate carboxykinase (ATP)